MGTISASNAAVKNCEKDLKCIQGMKQSFILETKIEINLRIFFPSIIVHSIIFENQNHTANMKCSKERTRITCKSFEMYSRHEAIIHIANED